MIRKNKQYKKKIKEDNMSHYSLPTKNIRIETQETNTYLNKNNNLENNNNKYTDKELDDLDF